MSKYSKREIEKVKSLDIRLFIPGSNIRKASQTIKCPSCGDKAFSVVHSKDKNFAYCHSCQFGLYNAIEAVSHYSGYDIKADYIKAVEEAARQGGTHITPEDDRRNRAVSEAKAANKGSFCQKQLEASGLTEEDVMADVIEGSQELQVPTFRKGRVDERFRPESAGDDMLIYYYRLDGRPVEYTDKKSGRPKPYVRVRWSNPAIKTDANGKEMKYQTPSGAPSCVYIPNKIRKAYKNRRHIETLFIQEGEKKAEKACKHGMMSIGIQGINNFGTKADGLLQDIQDIAKECTISNIVMIMDSDWDDLAKNIVINDRADKRPNSFSKAVIKYKQYMRTFANIGLSVDVWWGHVNANENKDKGVDDLLCGSLLGQEHELLDDIAFAMNSHDGKGKWLSIHKITAESDTKIREFWALDDAQAFYKRHAERLNDVGTFHIGSIKYHIEEGKLVPAGKYASAEIYTIEEDSKGKKKVEFNDIETFRFLNASGFYRLREADDLTSGFEYVRIDDGIIDRVAPYVVRDYIRDYVNANIKSDMVLQFFAKKLPTVMADKQLENLEVIDNDFSKFEKGVQRTCYNNGMVEITSQGIATGKTFNNVWRAQIKPRKFTRRPIIADIRPNGLKSFDIDYAPGAERCEFLQYIINTSNNYYRPGEEREVTPEEKADWALHIVNKITAIGYLLCDYKYASERRAVVIMDHSMSEVGQSFGGTGKSLFGQAIANIAPQCYIDGKKDQGDAHALTEVTRATRNVFIDDVKVNFDFEQLFTMITGPMPVNPKYGSRFTLPVESSPKILITTNHAINKADSGSVKRRILYVEHSNWYNSDYTPTNDFHHMLFDDWDAEQWCMFDNFMAECVMFYLRSLEGGWGAEGQGGIQPPIHSLELRTLRQFMGENFLDWAEEYFDPSGPNLNFRRDRKDLWAALVEYGGDPRCFGVTKANLRRKLDAYAKYKGFDINPYVPNKDGVVFAEFKKTNEDEPFVGGSDKSNGKEYITIFSAAQEKIIKPF